MASSPSSLCSLFSLSSLYSSLSTIATAAAPSVESVPIEETKAFAAKAPSLSSTLNSIPDSVNLNNERNASDSSMREPVPAAKPNEKCNDYNFMKDDDDDNIMQSIYGSKMDKPIHNIRIQYVRQTPDHYNSYESALDLFTHNFAAVRSSETLTELSLHSSPINNVFVDNSLAVPQSTACTNLYDDLMETSCDGSINKVEATGSTYQNKYCMQEQVIPIVQRLPEVSALTLNILLYDTTLNYFQDHNFDSCTLCVCHSGSKGNVSTNAPDTGAYLGFSENSYNPTSTTQGQTSGGAFNNNFGSGTSNHQGSEPLKCTCGFSAVVNRHLAHRSGLFYEDEMEITGTAEDPATFKQNGQLSFILNNNITSETLFNDPEDCDNISKLIMDQLQEQSKMLQNTCSSIFRVIRCDCTTSTVNNVNNSLVSDCDYMDAQDSISMEIDYNKLILETPKPNSKSDFRSCNACIGLHKWSFVKANGPQNNKAIVRSLKSMKLLIQDAFMKKTTSGAWNPSYVIEGPLTWRQFHRMASSSSGQCEPQSIPSVIVGHEKNWLSISPFAINYWDKLMLEPYSYGRDIAYIVIAPDNDYIVNNTKQFFKELSMTYEMCKLGRHNPVKEWNGILRIDNSLCQSFGEEVDEWFLFLDNSKTCELLKLYAQTLQQQLLPFLSKITCIKNLVEPPENLNTSSINHKESFVASPNPTSNTIDLHLMDKMPMSPKLSDNGKPFFD